MAKLTLTQVGDALGVILPEDILARLNVSAGDELILRQDGDDFLLSSATAETARQIEIGREIMHRHRGALKKLAE